MTTGWSRYDYLSHCRDEKEKGQKGEDCHCVCLWVATDQTKEVRGESIWGEGLQTATPEVVKTSSFSHRWHQFTHMKYKHVFIFSHENLFSDIMESIKASVSTSETLQDPGAGRATVGARALWYLCNIISLSSTITLSVFHGSILSCNPEAERPLKFIQSYFLVRAKYLKETNEIVFFIFLPISDFLKNMKASF